MEVTENYDHSPVIGVVLIWLRNLQVVFGVGITRFIQGLNNNSDNKLTPNYLYRQNNDKFNITFLKKG